MLELPSFRCQVCFFDVVNGFKFCKVFEELFDILRHWHLLPFWSIESLEQFRFVPWFVVSLSISDIGNGWIEA